MELCDAFIRFVETEEVLCDRYGTDTDSWPAELRDMYFQFNMNRESWVGLATLDEIRAMFYLENL